MFKLSPSWDLQYCSQILFPLEQSTEWKQWEKAAWGSLPTSYKATLEVSWVATVLFREAERVTDFRLLLLMAMLCSSARLAKVSLWKARKAGARQLPPLGVNFHSSSALQHGFPGKEVMESSPSRSPALGMSQNEPGVVPNIFECRHFILEGKMAYLFGHPPMVHHPTSRTRNKPWQPEETQSRLWFYIIMKAQTSNLRLKSTQHIGNFLIRRGKLHEELKWPFQTFMSMKIPHSKFVIECSTRFLSRVEGLTFLCSSGLMKTRSFKVRIILFGPLKSWLFKILCLQELESHGYKF